MTRQEADELSKIPGNVKGAIFQSHAVFIRFKKGDQGVKMVEEKLKELGHPLKFEEIKSLGWYPEALSSLVVVVAKDVFNWTDKDIFEMGNFAPKTSFVISLMVKYLLSPQIAFKAAGELWKKHLDFGELEAREFNKKEKYIVLRVKGYKFHPLLCIYGQGYYLRVAQFVIKSAKITIEETKCMFKGDPYHEYILRWE